ncbi:trypsin-like peptidase domain-containing protein [Variovorax sp. M-6]|uniref:trypsin-like peptidase domain-containing protein n=1 Tax=Variovorax sp. M-6 TaxID=3233041 RepID=UPI003F9B2621
MTSAPGRRGERLLQRCTVLLRVAGKAERGTGFFVSQNLVLTCQHVVEGAAAGGVVIQRGQHTATGTVLERPELAVRDLALVTIPDGWSRRHPVVRLDSDAAPLDDCYIFGYSDTRPEGDPVLLRLEGHVGPTLKLGAGQVRPGHSGSPILNLRTGSVCAVTQVSRGRDTDLGGLGMRVSPRELQLPTAADAPALQLWERVFGNPKADRPAWLIERKASDILPPPFTPAWFLFSESTIPLLGRAQEQSELADFLRTRPTFSWWTLLGPAGIGKSRLAHHVVQQHGATWSCGFVDLDDIDRVRNDLQQLDRPMLLVVDYASRAPARVRELLRTCAGLAPAPGRRVRVLLLEREAGKETGWWDELLPRHAAETATFRQHMHGEPRVLGGIQDCQRELLKAWLAAGAPDRLDRLPPPEAGFWADLAKASEGRPLLVGVAAAAFQRQDTVPDVLRMPELLRPIVERELRQWRQKCPDEIRFGHAVTVIGIGTLLRGLPLLGPDDPILVHGKGESGPELLLIPGPDGLHRLPTLRELDRLPALVVERVKASMSRVLGELGALMPGVPLQSTLQTGHDMCPTRWSLEPDMFGELLLDGLWNEPAYFDRNAPLPVLSDAQLQASLVTAWRIDAARTIATLADLRQTTSDATAFVRALRLLAEGVAAGSTGKPDDTLLDALAFVLFNASVRVARQRSSQAQVDAIGAALERLSATFPDSGSIAYRHFKMVLRRSVDDDIDRRENLRRRALAMAPKQIPEIQAHPADAIELHWCDTLVRLVNEAIERADLALMADIIASGRLLQASFAQRSPLYEELVKVYAAIATANATPAASPGATTRLTLTAELVASLAEGIVACLEAPAGIVAPPLRTRLFRALVNLSWANAQLRRGEVVRPLVSLITPRLHDWTDDATLAREVRIKLALHEQMTLPPGTGAEVAAGLAERAWQLLADGVSADGAQICLAMTRAVLIAPGGEDSEALIQTLPGRLAILPDTEPVRDGVVRLALDAPFKAAWTYLRSLPGQAVSNRELPLLPSLAGLNCVLNLARHPWPDEQALPMLVRARLLAAPYWADDMFKTGLLRCVLLHWEHHKPSPPRIDDHIEVRPLERANGRLRLEVIVRIDDGAPPERVLVELPDADSTGD